MESGLNKRASVIAAVVALFVVAALAGWLIYSQLASGPEPDGALTYVHPPVGASQTCSSCKADQHDYRHSVPYTGECEQCHTLRSWRDVSYAHPQSDFDRALHGVVGCPRCHTEGEPSPSPACETCHVERSPHEVGALSCGSCHGVVAWILLRPLPADHLSLLGGHEGLSCFDCHKDVRKTGAADRKCVDCHGKAHGGLTDCESCHEPERQWKPVPGFNHGAFFPITGRHRGLRCVECHTGGRFVGTPSNCSGCHGVVHTGLKKCESCHTTSGFVPSTFNHSKYFRITGRHTSLACSKCHIRGVYNGTPTRCAGCHGAKHGGLTACQDCHKTSGFRPSTFVHSSVFKLQGAHAKLACTKCHPGSKYATNIGGGGTTCGNCHDGPHGSGYETCSSCHSTTAWLPTVAITHPAPIVLGAKHRARPCKLCHPTLVFSAATKPCESSGCHAATVPHVGPTNCLNCHRPTTWAEVHFTHTDLGIHEGTNLNTQCLWCHPGPDYTKYDCKTCHIDNGIPWSDPSNP